MRPQIRSLMTETVVYEVPGYTIRWAEEVTEEMIRLLEDTTWGTDGAVFDHLDTRRKILSIRHPRVIYMTDEEGLVAMAVFCGRRVNNGGKTYKSFNIRYFAAHPRIQGKGIIKTFAEKVMGMIREEEPDPCIFYATIEGGNTRSFNTVVRAGYRHITTLRTLSFTRLRNKVQPGVRRLNSSQEQQQMQQLLEKQYRGYGLQHFYRLFQDDGYWVLERDGQILAGLQLIENKWALRSMGGAAGWFVLNVLPRLPFIRTIFQPERFHFLSYEALYCKDGNISYLYELMEGLLAEYGLHFSLFWLDENDPFYQQVINSAGQLGVFHRFTHQITTRVMISYANVPEEEQRQVEQLPVYTSSFDYV